MSRSIPDPDRLYNLLGQLHQHARTLADLRTHFGLRGTDDAPYSSKFGIEAHKGWKLVHAIDQTPFMPRRPITVPPSWQPLAPEAWLSLVRAQARELMRAVTKPGTIERPTDLLDFLATRMHECKSAERSDAAQPAELRAGGVVMRSDRSGATIEVPTMPQGAREELLITIAPDAKTATIASSTVDRIALAMGTLVDQPAKSQRPIATSADWSDLFKKTEVSEVLGLTTAQAQANFFNKLPTSALKGRNGPYRKKGHWVRIDLTALDPADRQSIILEQKRRARGLPEASPVVTTARRSA